MWSPSNRMKNSYTSTQAVELILLNRFSVFLCFCLIAHKHAHEESVFCIIFCSLFSFLRLFVCCLFSTKMSFEKQNEMVKNKRKFATLSSAHCKKTRYETKMKMQRKKHGSFETIFDRVFGHSIND